MLKPLIPFFASALVSLNCMNAAPVGSDAAHAFAYAEGWTAGDDGSLSGNPGTFGIWFLGGDGEHGIGDSTELAGGAGADINHQGKSFRLRSIEGSRADAYRFIDPDGLAIGQRFLIDLAVNFRGGSKGFVARGFGPENPELLRFEITNDDYLVSNAASGNGSISDYYANRTAFKLVINQTTKAGGIWEIERSGEFSERASGTYQGVLRSICLFNKGQGTASEDDLYFNSLRVESAESGDN